MFKDARHKLLTLAAEAEILSMQLARQEELRFRKGGVITYLLSKCGHQDTGLTYNGSGKLPWALSLAVRNVDQANDLSMKTGDYGILAGGLMGLVRVIRTNLRLAS